MEFKELSKKAKEIKDAYAQLNRREGKKVWKASEYAQGLVGDVGDLVKLIMAKNNFRSGVGDAKNAKKLERELRHELADCLWSVMAIAQELDIDLEKEFLINMDYLRQKLYEKLKKK